MSLPGYEKYKTSGVKWLGDYPEHWDLRRLKFVADIQTGDKDTVDAEDSGEYPFFVRSQTVERINSFTYDCEAILTAGDGVGVGKVFHHYNGPFDFHQRVYMMNNFQEIDGRFLFYYLRENFYKVALEGGAKSTVDSIRRPMIADFPVTIPPEVEQAAIVDFLDRETAKIDDLIAEQKKLTALLKEKRQAVISHAVTKGLNPDAPLKDSGIEWLGDVPEHWEVVPVKRGITKISQGFSPQCHSEPASDEEWGVVKVGCCNKFDLNEGEQKRLPPEIEPVVDYEIQDGDILMSRGNTLDLVGMAALVRGVRPRLLLCDLVYRFRAMPDHFDPAFLVFSLRSRNVRSQIEFSAVGSSSTMKKVSQELVRNLLICRPPVTEQQEISTRLLTMSKDFDVLEMEAKQAIKLLQERRTALISAAVTGKIDVREKSQKTKRNKKGGSQYFRRTVFAAKIVDDLCEEKTFGHVKFQKCLYLIQHHLQLDNLLESYKRMAAGPYDNRLIRSVDSQLKKKQWFEAQKIGKGYKYKRLEKYQEYEPYFKRYFEQQESEIEKLISLLRPLDTQRCEIIATLYAAWNDFLLQNKPIDDSQIVDEVLTNWNESKNTIPRERWMKALDWMRKKKLIPSGFGQPTILPTEGRS